MMKISLSALGYLAGSTNGKAGLNTDVFALVGGGAGTFMLLLFKRFSLVLLLEFILHVRKRIASNITVPQLVDCSSVG